MGVHLPNRKKEIDQEGYERLIAKLNQSEKEFEEINSLYASTVSEETNREGNSSILYVMNQLNAKATEIAQLKSEIASCIVVDFKANDDVVCLGDKVTLEMNCPGMEVMTKTYTLVSSSPKVLSGEISQQSPVGQFILGKAVGTSGKVLLNKDTGLTGTVKIISKAK